MDAKTALFKDSHAYDSDAAKTLIFFKPTKSRDSKRTQDEQVLNF